MADRRLEATGALLVALVGGFVWLTRHPEAAIVDRAADWPLVGGAARAFRDRWRPAPPPPPPPAPEPDVEYVYRIESDGPSPGRPALQWPPRAGAAAPSGAPEVRRFASRDAAEPVGPLPGRAADPFRLERARGLLGEGARAVPLGPYTLWSDLDDAALAPLAARWRTLAEGADAAWSARYGVAPVGGAAETIVLFARAAAFGAYVAAEPQLAGSGAHGVAGWGLVALAAEGRAADELDGLFAHELAHLLTRRAIGPALPPWLAEGLAEDFGHAPWIDGAPRFDRARGEVRRDGLRFELRGGVAVLDLAGRRAAAGAPSDLATLAAFDDTEFGAGDPGVDRYGDAFVWIRFLLAEPARATAFRAYLAEIRAGGSPELAALERRLGEPVVALAEPFVAWLLPWRAAELARHGAPAALPDGEGRVAASPTAAAPGG